VASNNPDGQPIYRVLNEKLAASFKHNPPSALVFDFTQLEYKWGDQMAELLRSWGVPFMVVKSSFT